MAAVLAVMSFVIYALIGLMPGDPIDVMIASDPHLTAADAVRLKALYGLDRPLMERYLAWAQAASTAISATRGSTCRRPWRCCCRARQHGGADGLSFTLALALALPLGIVASRRPGSLLDGAVNMLAFAFISVPSFWLALMLIFVFAVSLGLVPAGASRRWATAACSIASAIWRCRWRRSRWRAWAGICAMCGRR